MILIFLIFIIIILALSGSLIVVRLLNGFSTKEILLYGVEISIVGLTVNILSINSSSDNLYFYMKLLSLFITIIGMGIFILVFKDRAKRKD